MQRRVSHPALLRVCGACSARENGNRRPQTNSLSKQPEALTSESWNNLIKPCDIPPGPLQACHETIPDEIAGCGNYDWYVFRGFLSGESGRYATQDDHIDLQFDEFCRKRWQSIKLALGIARLNGIVLTLLIPELTHAVDKGTTIW